MIDINWGWVWQIKGIKGDQRLSFEELLQLLHILSQLSRTQLPVKPKIIEHAFLSLPPLWNFAAIIPSSIAVPSIGCCSTRDFYLLAPETIEDSSVVAWIKISTFRMYPSFTLITHDPLLAVVTEVEVDLLAIQAKGLFLVLTQAIRTQALHVVLMGEVVLAWLVGLADLVAADIGVGVGVGLCSLLFRGFVLAGRRGRVVLGLTWGLFVVVLDLLGNACAKVHCVNQRYKLWNKVAQFKCQLTNIQISHIQLLINMILSKIGQMNKMKTATLCLAFHQHFASLHLIKFSPNAQRAVWASAMIKEIHDAQPSGAYDSLRRKMRELKLQSLVVDFNEDIEKEMKLMFNDGIAIDPLVEESKARVLLGANVNQKFVFCPSYIVTKQMFKHLYNTRESLFVSGEYGTSKTISTILASTLSQKILKFKFEAKNDEQKRKELAILKQHQLIHNTPKFLYWSISENKKQIDENDLMAIIKQQFSDLPIALHQQLQKTKNLKQLNAFIKKAYWECDRILIKVVIDQINTAASTIRDWNSKVAKEVNMLNEKQITLEQKLAYHKFDVEQCSSWEEKDQCQNAFNKEIKPLNKEINQIKKMIDRIKKENNDLKNKAINLTSLLSAFRQLGHLVLFNSSVNVEDDILKQSYQRNFPLIGLQILQFHDRIVRAHIDYFSSLKKKQGKNDFFNYFWFEIQRRIMQKRSKNIPQQFEKKLYEILQNEEIKHYSRPVFACQFVGKNINNIENSLFPLNEGQPKITKEDQTAYLRGLIKRYNQYCFNQSKAKIEKFVSTDQKKTIITIIYFLARMHVAYKVEELTIHVQTFYNHFRVLLSELFLSNNHNKQLIPLRYNEETKQIIFHWDPREFMQITENVVNFEKLYKQLMSNDYIKAFRQRYQSPKGYFFQYTVVEILKPEISIKFFNKNTNPKLQQFEQKTYTIFSQSAFTPLENTPNDSILHNFRAILKEAKQHPLKIIVGKPIIQIKSSQKGETKYGDKGENVEEFYDVHSRSIDFVLVSYHQNKQPSQSHYQISTFDITIAEQNKSGKEQKPNHAKEMGKPKSKDQKAVLLFQNLIKNSHDINFELHHTILCSTESCIQSSPEKYDKLTIQYSSYELLEIPYCPKQYFYHLTEFLVNRQILVKEKLQKGRTNEDR